MNSYSFTAQDIFGSVLALLLFPVVFLSPGYVIGWTFDLFKFKNRLPLVRILISIVLSIAICPILIYLPYRLVDGWLVWLVLLAFFIGFLWLIIWEWVRSGLRAPIIRAARITRSQLLALIMGGGWVIFCILNLVDIQLGNRLYYTVISLDYLSRAALIDAITRTGVPPVNPSYYPGHPEQLTFLYYYWYVLCSLIDQLGGKWVDSRAALVASVCWCGLGLMATIALYLRFRNLHAGQKAWRSAFIGAGLLLVSGLDIIPILFYMLIARFQTGIIGWVGDIEHWNDQVTAWLGAIQWVPNHVASLIACLAGMMLAQSIDDYQSFRKKIVVSALAGLSFASALGLSTWITLLFAVFWGVWIGAIYLERRDRKRIIFMLCAGVVALLASIPFIIGLLQTGSSAGLPISFIVRRFHPIMPFIDAQPMWIQNAVNLILLPINYLFELGFFFLIGLVWLQHRRRLKWRENPYRLAEVILLATTILLVTFFRSVIISGNDFGWRGWMFAQFVLLIWAVDLFEFIWEKGDTDLGDSIRLAKRENRSRKIIWLFLVFGLATTLLDLFLLRSFDILVDSLNQDAHIGERTFAARRAYNYIRDSLPEDLIVQDNPAVILDRPSGLYGSRQMAISDHTAYGVPKDRYQGMVDRIGRIFSATDFDDWTVIDKICRKYSINLLVFKDTDPVWQSLSQLDNQRAPLYRNSYYQIFRCGDFTGPF